MGSGVVSRGALFSPNYNLVEQQMESGCPPGELLWLLDSENRPIVAKTSEKPRQNRLARFLETTPGWQTGMVLILVGAGLSVHWQRLECYPKVEQIAASLGEALFIAGILALLVDPFLKARLQRDASRSIFEHMLGFDHEPELKAKLRSIAFDTKLYRRDYKLECDISMPNQESGKVQLDLNGEYELLNASLDSIEHSCGWTFVEVDNPSGCEITMIVGEGAPEVSRPAFDKEGSGYVGAKADPIRVEPKENGRRYRFASKCLCIAPQDWYHTIYFSYPTIDAVITVTAPEGWRVWIGGQEDRNSNSARWHSPGIFMPGDKVEIHWRKPSV